MAPDSIRSAFAVQIPAGPARVAISQALDAIDAVHQITGNPTRIPIRAFSGPPDIRGGYRCLTDGTPVDIVVNRAGVSIALTVLHEVGHYLDDQAIGSPGTFASAADELPEWWAAVDASGAVGRLRELENQAPVTFTTPAGFGVVFDPDDFAYLLEREELFARSYAQYTATRSGAPVPLSELHAAQSIVYPQQWPDDDFKPIGAAFDQLLERLGWSGS